MHTPTLLQLVVGHARSFACLKPKNKYITQLLAKICRFFSCVFRLWPSWRNRQSRVKAKQMSNEKTVGEGVRRKGKSQRAPYYPGYKYANSNIFPIIQWEISDKLGLRTTNGVMMVLMCYVSSCSPRYPWSCIFLSLAKLHDSVA